MDRDLLDPAIPAGWNEPKPCSCLPTAIGHALLIVVLGPGQFCPRQILHATDKLRTVAKARPNLGVAGTGLPPGENPPFQRPEHLRIARRTRPTMRPRTKGQNLGHTPSAAPESPGHLSRVNTGRYEPAYPPLDWPQVCVASYYVRFHHSLRYLGRLPPSLFRRTGMAGAVGRGLILRREGQGTRVRAGQAMSDPERFGPVAPAPCPSRTAVPIGQRSATRASRALARVARGQRPCLARARDRGRQGRGAIRGRLASNEQMGSRAGRRGPFAGRCCRDTPCAPGAHETR